MGSRRLASLTVLHSPQGQLVTSGAREGGAMNDSSDDVDAEESFRDGGRGYDSYGKGGDRGGDEDGEERLRATRSLDWTISGSINGTRPWPALRARVLLPDLGRRGSLILVLKLSGRLQLI